LAEIAYRAGVRQIVDISSFTVRFLRRGVISFIHSVSEENILKSAGKNQYLVALRPGYFMNNMLHDAGLVKSNNIFAGVGSPKNRVGFVDTRDISDIASVVLSDPIEKHGNAVYDIHAEVFSYEEKAAFFTKVLGKEVKYVQKDVMELYGLLSSRGLPHAFCYDFISLGLEDFNFPTPQIEILLGKKPRKLEDWIRENKNAFL